MRTSADRLAAEAFGTFWLVFGGCGAAIFAGKYIGFYGVALAFGLTVVTMAYAVGHVSGGHFNPAITIGLAMGRRFDWKEVPAYVVTQVVAAIVAATALWVIAHGVDGFDSTETTSPPTATATTRPAATLVGRAHRRGRADGLLPLRDPRRHRHPCAQGLRAAGDRAGADPDPPVSIPIANTSVNPARSIGPALFAGTDAILQLWAFILAPIVGAPDRGRDVPRAVRSRARSLRRWRTPPEA